VDGQLRGYLNAIERPVIRTGRADKTGITGAERGWSGWTGRHETDQPPREPVRVSTRVFDSRRSREYVDGDAERYLPAGIQQTCTTNHRYLDRLKAVADVHRMTRAKGLAFSNDAVGKWGEPLEKFADVAAECRIRHDDPFTSCPAALK